MTCPITLGVEEASSFETKKLTRQIEHEIFYVFGYNILATKQSRWLYSSDEKKNYF